MPNLAHFRHFEMVADGVVFHLTKVDQLCRTFSKIDLKIQGMPKWQV